MNTLANLSWGDLPPAEFSQCPFWFWNDVLDENELRRQIADFQAHGVEAFVIHPRIGLPRTQGWMSPALLGHMKFAIEEAAARGMWLMLYDEGMYPSGSASGGVVARNPDFQTRALTCSDHAWSPEDLSARCGRFIARTQRKDGRDVWIYHQKVAGVVRGLHYVGDEEAGEPGEETPPAADLLNPEAVQAFIELVYARFHAEFGGYFGKTIKAIFTDEPHPLGRFWEEGFLAGSPETLEIASRMLGRDFTPHLPALWFNDEPDATLYRRIHREAIAERLDETYYRPLAAWCESHGIALTGHPAEPDELGHLRHFQIPGQDIVWRHIERGSSAIEGAPSTMAKAAASAKLHHQRSRNLNEFAGAYGHALTFSELQWLASWLLIRGCDLLVPHAFYYSMRGLRREERPPDAGPNSPWWEEYKPWADFTRRICALNASCQPVCEVAILGRATELPWKAAKRCFEQQIDFHYVEPNDLGEARMDGNALVVGPARYSVLIVEEGYESPGAIPSIKWSDQDWAKILGEVSPIVTLSSAAPDLRARRLSAPGAEWVLLFNEGQEVLEREVTLPWTGEIWQMDLMAGQAKPSLPRNHLRLLPGEWAVYQTFSRPISAS